MRRVCGDVRARLRKNSDDGNLAQEGAFASHVLLTQGRVSIHRKAKPAPIAYRSSQDVNKRRHLGSVIGMVHDERIGVKLAILRRQRLLDSWMSAAFDTQRSTAGKRMLGH